jgi:hypothetical protein
MGDDGCLVGCGSVQFGRILQMTQRFLLPPSAGLLMFTVKILNFTNTIKLKLSPQLLLIVSNYSKLIAFLYMLSFIVFLHFHFVILILANIFDI